MTRVVIDLEAGGGTEAYDPGDAVAAGDEELAFFVEEGELMVGHQVADEARAVHAEGLEAVALAGEAQAQGQRELLEVEAGGVGIARDVEGGGVDGLTANEEAEAEGSFVEAVEGQEGATGWCRGGRAVGVLHQQASTVAQEAMALTALPQLAGLALHGVVDIAHLLGGVTARMQDLMEDGLGGGGLLESRHREAAVGL